MTIATIADHRAISGHLFTIQPSTRVRTVPPGTVAPTHATIARSPVRTAPIVQNWTIKPSCTVRQPLPTSTVPSREMPCLPTPSDQRTMRPLPHPPRWSPPPYPPHPVHGGGFHTAESGDLHAHAERLNPRWSG